MSVREGFDTPPRQAGHGEEPSRAPGHGGLGTAVLGPLAATVVVGLPQLPLVAAAARVGATQHRG